MKALVSHVQDASMHGTMLLHASAENKIVPGYFDHKCYTINAVQLHATRRQAVCVSIAICQRCNTDFHWITLYCNTDVHWIAVNIDVRPAYTSSHDAATFGSSEHLDTYQPLLATRPLTRVGGFGSYQSYILQPHDNALPS